LHQSFSGYRPWHLAAWQGRGRGGSLRCLEGRTWRLSLNRGAGDSTRQAASQPPAHRQEQPATNRNLNRSWEEDEKLKTWNGRRVGQLGWPGGGPWWAWLRVCQGPPGPPCGSAPGKGSKYVTWRLTASDEGGVWLLLLKFSPSHIKRLTFK
jgi:hypothetical protein